MTAIETRSKAAVRLGVAHGPRALQELLIAFRMAKREGLATALAHLRAIALVRTHRRLFDHKRQRGLPFPALRETMMGTLSLATDRTWEVGAAAAHSPIPSKTLKWALDGLDIDPTQFEFVDCGSGTGQALLPAAEYPFKGVTGIEFAEQLHQAAQHNLSWATKNGRLKARRVTLLHGSVLEAELPEGPTVLFLFNPFYEPVMSRFVEQIEESVKAQPRPMLIVYVNPKVASAFERDSFIPLSLATRQRLLISLFSPFRVRAYSCQAIETCLDRQPD